MYYFDIKLFIHFILNIIFPVFSDLIRLNLQKQFRNYDGAVLFSGKNRFVKRTEMICIIFIW